MIQDRIRISIKTQPTNELFRFGSNHSFQLTRSPECSAIFLFSNLNVRNGGNDINQTNKESSIQSSASVPLTITFNNILKCHFYNGLQIGIIMSSIMNKSLHSIKTEVKYSAWSIHFKVSIVFNLKNSLIFYSLTLPLLFSGSPIQMSEFCYVKIRLTGLRTY